MYQYQESKVESQATQLIARRGQAMRGKESLPPSALSTSNFTAVPSFLNGLSTFCVSLHLNTASRILPLSASPPVYRRTYPLEMDNGVGHLAGVGWKHDRVLAFQELPPLPPPATLPLTAMDG